MPVRPFLAEVALTDIARDGNRTSTGQFDEADSFIRNLLYSSFK
jgi:hypothetical protein